MALYLDCGLCGRKQADGLLSRGYWGHLETSAQGMLRACPACKEQHNDWQNRLLAAVGDGAGGVQPAYGIGQSSFR